jgi:hypothetical protein
VPWGVSESAYNVRDVEYTYQYSNFGIPGLGLKRGLDADLVIAPYATALAAMVDPAAAVLNLERIAAVDGQGRYGFYEALDYTPDRVPAGKSVAVVRVFMAHHQGMTIVAIADAVLNGVMRARFHAEPIIQATELLLQERAPRNTASAIAHDRQTLGREGHRAARRTALHRRGQPGTGHAPAVQRTLRRDLDGSRRRQQPVGGLVRHPLARGSDPRRHATRLLNGGSRGRPSGPRPARRIYNDAVREALIVLWEASDRICGKRLRPLVPVMLEAMERHGHLQLIAEVRTGLLAMSAATMDRALREAKGQPGGKNRRRAPPSAGVRRSVPVRTFSDWGDPAPGFIEADLVAHGGPTAAGSFIQTLVLTDIATGWVECAPLLYREQKLLTEVLNEVRKLLPFPLLGFDTDNDTVFMNETVRDYCRISAIVFTRCRPYQKNDQAWVEQKNGAVVRRIVGYRRFAGLEAAAVLARLYRSVRLFVNFFQPSFKLAEKSREGAKVRKSYHPPATPYQRLIADARATEEIKRQVKAQYETLDPVRLLSDIRAGQRRLVEVADAPDVAFTIEQPTLEQFLLSLRTAWQEGEVRPTTRRKPPVKKKKRNTPDPFVLVAVQLRSWFEAEPWRSSGELFRRLQTEHPGLYADGQARTLQRRLKEWRREMARLMVFRQEPTDGARGEEPAMETQ